MLAEGGKPYYDKWQKLNRSCYYLDPTFDLVDVQGWHSCTAALHATKTIEHSDCTTPTCETSTSTKRECSRDDIKSSLVASIRVHARC